MTPESFFIITSLLKIIGILFVVILPMVSYTVYAERKVSAAIQDRLGQIVSDRPAFFSQLPICSNCC